GGGRGDAGGAGRALGRAEQDLAARWDEHQRAAQEAANAESELDASRDRATAALRSVAEAARQQLDDEAVGALGVLAGAVATIEPGLPADAGAIERPLTALRRGFDSAREIAAERAALAEGEAKRMRAEARATVEPADEIRTRAAVLPDLPVSGGRLAG